MRGLIAALTLTAIAGCEQPGFDEYLDTYAPACDNKPHVSGTFDEFSIECGEYFFEYRDDGIDLFCRLEKQAGPCAVLWVARGCGEAPGYWSMACLELDDEGNELSRSSAFNVPATEEQAHEYAETLENIGYESARQRWIDWNRE